MSTGKAPVDTDDAFARKGQQVLLLLAAPAAREAACDRRRG
jgi:hypothetical protein